MKAGRLNYFLTPKRLQTVTNPETGETRREWTEEKEIRAERVKITAKAMMKGPELIQHIDAAFYVRFAHPIADGWRVKDREGIIYDVNVEPNREKGLKLLKCSKIND